MKPPRTPRYIIVGETSPATTSRVIIGRSKGPEELRDVFYVFSDPEMFRAVLGIRRYGGRAYVFRVLDDSAADPWFLVSFDVKYVYGRKSGRKRYATYEYTLIREAMFFSLCGAVDNSTYICPEDDSDIPQAVIGSDGRVVVDSYPVEPLDEEAEQYVRAKIAEALDYVKTLITAYQAKEYRGRLTGKAAARARRVTSWLLAVTPQAREKVERLLGEKLDSLLSAAEYLSEKLKASGSRKDKR